MNSYYSGRLAGERLRQCYDLAPVRVRQYLEAEVSFLLRRVNPADAVLELGSGYGRIAHRLASVARQVVGIDTCIESLALARKLNVRKHHCDFVQMDAVALGFADAVFAAVICAQNGLSAFGVDPARVLTQALRVTCFGGRVILSSYSAEFWSERLRWFELQAAAGLIGPIDYENTGGGAIACLDGFRATTFGPEEFTALCSGLGLSPQITVVDDSCVFCEIRVEGSPNKRLHPTGTAPPPQRTQTPRRGARG